MFYICSLNNREIEFILEMDKVKFVVSKLYYWFILISFLKVYVYVCLMNKDIWWFLLMYVVICIIMIFFVF